MCVCVQDVNIIISVFLLLLLLRLIYEDIFCVFLYLFVILLRRGAENVFNREHVHLTEIGYLFIQSLYAWLKDVRECSPISLLYLKTLLFFFCFFFFYTLTHVHVRCALRRKGKTNNNIN